MIRFQCLGVNIKMNNFSKKIICFFFSILIFCNCVLINQNTVSAYVANPSIFANLYSFAMTLASDKKSFDDLAASIDAYFDELWYNSEFREVFYPNIGVFREDDIQKIKYFRRSINSTGKIPDGYTDDDILMAKYDIEYFDNWVGGMSAIQKHYLVEGIRQMYKSELGIDKWLFDLDLVRSTMVSFNEYVDKIVDERIKIDGMDMNIPYLDVLDMRQKIFDSYDSNIISINDFDFYYTDIVSFERAGSINGKYVENYINVESIYGSSNYINYGFIFVPFLLVDEKLFIPFYNNGGIVSVDYSSFDEKNYKNGFCYSKHSQTFNVVENALLYNWSYEINFSDGFLHSNLKYYDDKKSEYQNIVYTYNQLRSFNVNLSDITNFSDYDVGFFIIDSELAGKPENKRYYEYFTFDYFFSSGADASFDVYNRDDIETVFAPVLDVARPQDIVVSLPTDKTSVSASDIVVTDTKTGTSTNVEAIASGSMYDLDFDIDVPQSIFQKFPFSLPWDFYNLVHIFSAEPITPSFVLPFKYKNLFDFSIDLDLEQFDFISDISRSLFYVVFLVFLIFSTKKLIWNGG